MPRTISSLQAPKEATRPAVLPMLFDWVVYAESRLMDVTGEMWNHWFAVESIVAAEEQSTRALL